MSRVQALTSSLALLLLAVAVCASTESRVPAESARVPSPPTGSIALTSVNDPLAAPIDAPLMSKTTFAVGNNVVITKSNIIIRKDAGGSGSDSVSAEAPTAKASIPSLAQAIQDAVARSTNQNATMDAVLDMLGMVRSSPAFGAVRSRVATLFQHRSDRSALLNHVAALVDAVNTLDKPKTPLSAQAGDKDDQDNDKQQVVGYRTLFHWTADGRAYIGWRYPLRYWLRFGSSRLGGSCGLGLELDGFFYC